MAPRRCRHHGGNSTGPKSAAGKKRVRQNAIKHGGLSDPARWREDLAPEREAMWRALVDAICEAEAVSSPLDRCLVEAYATTAMIGGQVEAYMRRHGVITAQKWRRLGESEHLDEDIGGAPIRDVEVSERVVDTHARLASIRRDLHRQLRAAAGDRGDPTGAAFLEDMRRRIKD